MLELKTAILAANTNQSQLATETGLSYVTIQNVLSGKVCSVKTCNKITAALGVPVTTLFPLFKNVSNNSIANK